MLASVTFAGLLMGSPVQAVEWRMLAENARGSIDIATRRTESLTDDGWSGLHVFGIDLQTVLSGNGGDIGVITLQPYFARLVNVDQPNATFEDPGSWELTWRISNINFKVLDRGRLNVRLGHFELPFGLEQNLDTNGTLRQFTFRERGIKVDWGVTANGQVGGAEYEIAASLGSGNDIEQRSGSSLVSGRIGTSSRGNFIVGASFMSGDVQTAAGAISRDRLAIDLALYRNNWEFLLEASTGSDDDADRDAIFADIAWQSPRETFLSYLQLHHYTTDGPQGGTTERSVAVGSKLTLRRFTLLSAELRRSFIDASNDSASTSLTLQLRHRLER